MPILELPDGSEIEFPEGATEEMMLQAIVANADSLPVSRRDKLLGRNPLAEKALDTLQTMGVVASNFALMPFAGIAGLSGSIHGQEVANRSIDDVLSLAMQPSREGSEDQLSGISRLSDFIADPFGSMLPSGPDPSLQLNQFAGNKVLDKTGSPFLATTTSMMPELLASLFPAKYGETAIKAGAKNLTGGPSTPISRQRGSIGIMKNDPDEIDYDFPLTHESSDPGFDGVIRNREGAGDVFSGLFALEGNEGAALGPGGYNHTYYPRKNKVAGHGDSDLDYEQSIEFLRKEYPNATDEQVDLLYELAAEDREFSSLLDDETLYRIQQEDGLHPLSEILPSDIGEASWEAQNIRGKLAIDQGFDAIAVSDENETSYFIPFGSRAITKK